MNAIKRLTLVLFVLTLLLYLGFRFIEYKKSDSLAPVITMDSDSITISVQDSEQELLKGVKAEDNKDGDITSSIIIEEITSFINGKRIITYAVSDSHNNVTRATRELIYKDYTSPKFTITSPLAYSLGVTAEDILSDIKAYDVVGGDITNKVKVSFDNPVEAGSYEALLSVTNSCGDTVSLKVPIEVYSSSYTPQIYLTDYVIYTKVGEAIDPYSYLDTIAMGKSNDKGRSWRSYSDSLSVNDESDSTKAGTYLITYQVTINGYVGKVALVAVVQD